MDVRRNPQGFRYPEVQQVPIGTWYRWKESQISGTLFPTSIRVTKPTRHKDLDVGSDAMQPYRLAVLDWVDLFAIER